MNSDSKTLHAIAEISQHGGNMPAGSAAPATPDKCPTCESDKRNVRRISYCTMTAPPRNWRWVMTDRLDATNQTVCDDPWHSGAAPATKPPDLVTKLQSLRPGAEVNASYRAGYQKAVETLAELAGVRAAESKDTK
jgi:hypothetical protein